MSTKNIKQQIQESLDDAIILAQTSYENMVKAKAVLMDSIAESSRARELSNQIGEKQTDPMPIPDPDPEPTPEPEPTPKPTPDPEIPDNFDGIGAEDFVEIYGNDFQKAVTETGTNNRHFVIKDNVLLEQDVDLPKNIRFTFIAGGKVIVKSKSRWKSLIVAHERQHIFQVEGSADFKLMPPSTPIVSLFWFGAKENVDISDIVNKTIQATDFIGAYLLPTTDHENPYVVSKTLDFVSWQKPDAIVFNSWELLGKKTSDASDNRTAVSKIVHIGNEAPAVNIRGARWLTKIKDLQIEGKNSKPRAILDQGTQNSRDLWNPNNWKLPELSIDRTQHYSGLAFDWVKDGEDSKPWSAQAIVEGVKINRFVVGASISPSDGMQADTITFNKVKISDCVYGASIGQDQVRAVSFNECMFDGMLTFFTNNKFGRRNGSKFSVRGGQYTTALKAFDISTQYLGTGVVDGAYFEHIGCIGAITSSGNNSNPFVFRDCTFILDDDGYTDNNGFNWDAPFNTLVGGANIVFENCEFRSKRKFLAFSSGINGRYTFKNCSFHDIYEILVDGVLSSDRQERLSMTNNSWYYGEERSEPTDLNDIPVANVARKYVRFGIPYYLQLSPDGSSIKTVPTQNYQTYINSNFAPLTTEPDKVFTAETGEAVWYQVGDFVGGYTDGNLDGMYLGNQELQVPCLQVIKVDGNKVTFKKLSSDVKMTANSNWWGSIYAFNKCLISRYDLQLKAGDWFNDDKGINRIKPDGTPVRPIEGVIRGR